MIKKMKMHADELLKEMIGLLLQYVEELSKEQNTANAAFAYGERTAYTECLEILQKWEYAETAGLDFDIEKKYPL